MYTYYKWRKGIHLFDLVKIWERMFFDLGWQSEWGTKNGKPVFALTTDSWTELNKKHSEGSLRAPGVRHLVTAAELSLFPDLLTDPDLTWDLSLSYYPLGYSKTEVPIHISCGYIWKRCPDWIDMDYSIRSDGVVTFMDCGLYSRKEVQFYYNKISASNLSYYVMAYEFNKELWNAFGADTCYGRHHKTGEPQIQSEPGLFFQFSRIEPVRLLLPLEERRVPSAEEVENDIPTPGLWHQAIGRRDLDVGQWDWKPRGLKALGIPKSKQEWEDAGFPEAIG